ncbi:MAG: hypothetical protein E5W70_31770 [Mesorhizobium sp.]|uniref:SHOCT domain-containing protein n=1 Tax=Mesorhizobium sp. TaxID=1871066 RepID=UPI0011F60932|nr:hypothetical protein [Mesorhizobium sp.]TIT17633.1 MAG: hypothetical protein E5W70_31770 [Mesorhizobium sp.]
MQKVLIPIFATVVSAALTLAPGAVSAQAPSGGNRYDYGPGMMGWDGGSAMIFGPLFMILFLGVLIAAVVLLSRWAGGPWQGSATPHHTPSVRTPVDILKERFARDEIDKEELEERRRVLGE